MRVGFDATPAAVQGAGVGRYARELLRALLPLNPSDDYRLLNASDAEATARLLDSLPPGALRRMYRIPIPDRYLTAAWQRLRLPLAVERVIGPIDVFHGPDFVLPPSRSASVVTIHDLSFLVRPDLGEPRLTAYLTRAVPRAIESSHRIIAVSATVAGEIIERFPYARERVVAIPNGVRASDPGPRRQRSSRPIVLTVGTIEPRKNHLGLVEAMRYVRQCHPDAILQVAGRVGWLSREIMDVLRAEERAGRLTVIEGPDDEQLDELYRAANVFAYPSWYEGFGLPVLEAMTRSVPVVAADIPALREAGGDAAAYADPADPESIGAAIVQILDDASRATRLAALGRARASRFSWRQTAIATRRVYGQVAP